jgi:hypothetical protein
MAVLSILPAFDPKGSSMTVEVLRARLADLQVALDSIETITPSSGKNKDDDGPLFYSIKQTAERWNTSQSTIRRYKRAGLIAFHRFSSKGKIYIEASVVKRGPPL